MSEMITKNHALIAEFGDSLDRLLDGIENFLGFLKKRLQPIATTG